jgi:hypothetical protein
MMSSTLRRITVSETPRIMASDSLLWTKRFVREWFE